jgi:aminoglycoside phosphotransferase
MNPDQAWLAFPALTAGYRWRSEGTGQLATALHRLKVGLLNASTLRYYTRRGFAVLKATGVRGLVRKLSR